MCMRLATRVLASLSLVLSGSVIAADWGDLKARFVIDGAAPTLKPLVINKDEAFCGKFGLTDELLVVNPSNGGIANVIVFLYLARDAKAPPVHESYAESAKASVALDNEKCRFEPRVVALRTTQTLVVGNKDPIGHNTKIDTLNNPPQNPLIPPNGSLKLNFPTVENLPSPVSCSIHPWMKAHVVVKDHPYVGVSDKDGQLLIKNVPAGKWTFQFWQEASGYVTQATVDGKKTTWARGRAELEIKKGGTDLKEVKLSPSIFKLN